MVHFRNVGLLLGFMLVVQGLTNAQSRGALKIAETELERFSAMVQQDTVALRTMLDDDLYYLHSNGHHESKKQHLEAIAAGSIVYKAMKREPNPTIRHYGKLGIINGRVQVEGQFNSSAFSVLLEYTAVYRKKKRRWLLLRWQSTRVDRE
jgi:hypothetical protein